jgi:hypothetical protein
MKRLIQLLATIALFVTATSCESEEANAPHKYLITTEKGMYQGPWGFKQPYYIIYDYNTKEWHDVEGLIQFTPEYGYEYVVEGKLTTGEDYWNMGLADAVSDLQVYTVISQEAKTSEIPEEKQKAVESYNAYFGNEYLIASQQIQLPSPISDATNTYLQVCDLKTNEWYLSHKHPYRDKYISGREYIVRGKVYTLADYIEMGFSPDELLEPHLEAEYIISSEEKTSTIPESWIPEFR